MSVKETRSLNNIFNFKESEKSLTMDSLIRCEKHIIEGVLWVTTEEE
jgi:hypothetical protein